MRTYFRCVVTLIFIFCLSLAALGQTPKEPNPISPEKLALIKELVAVTDAAKASKQTMTQNMQAMTVTLSGMLAGALSKDLAGQNLSAEQMAQAKKMSGDFMANEMKTMSEFMVKGIDFDTVVTSIYVPLYDKYYTDQELRDLIAFYKTPTGQKSASVTPSFNADVAAMTMQFMMPTMMQHLQEGEAQLEKDIQNFVDGLKRMGNGTSSAPPNQ